MNRGIAALCVLAVLLVGSPAVAGEGSDPPPGGETIVTGAGDSLEVIVENDGGEIEVVVGGRQCTYHKIRGAEVLPNSGTVISLSPEQLDEFIRQIRDDDRNFFLYAQVCDNGEGTAPVEYIWLEALTPISVSESARQELIRIAPSPIAGFSPDATLRQLVGLATFVWIDEVTLAPITAEASIPGLTATATATPARLVLDPGDGTGPLECELDITPYTEGADPESSCTHTFQCVSSRSPTGTWDFTVSLEWDVTWVNTLGDAGVADPLRTQSIYPLVVIEAQARTTNG